MKNKILSLLLKSCFISMLFSPTILLAECEEMKMNPYGQYFEDGYGFVAIEAAMLEEKNEHGLNDMIMIMSGFEAYEVGIDDKAILYRAIPSGKGFELVTTVGGKDFTRFVSKNRWGSWQDFVVNLSGKDINLSSNEKMAKQIRPLHLRTAFNQPQKESEKYEVNPYGIALSNSEGDIKVSIAIFSKENNNGQKDALIMVEGRTAYAEGIDGKVLKYMGIPGSDRGTEYQYSKGEKNITRMIRKFQWGGSAWSIFLDGKNHDLYVVSNESSNIRPQHLLTAYKDSIK